VNLIRWTLLTSLLIATGCAVGWDADLGGPGTADIVVEGVDLSETEVGRVVATALADDRLGDLLTAHPYRVESVRSPAAGSGLVVTLGFDDPLADDAAWPLDVCAIDTGGLPITGVVWLVEDGSVRAVSPRWGDDLACGY
jgi:hypothetical protein